MFYKDIWSLIFEKLEFNLDFESLNSLSLTCKKLYQLDLERQINLLKDLEKEDFLIHIQKILKKRYIYQFLSVKENFLLSGYKKNRNFLKLIKYRDIGILDIETYKKAEILDRSFFCVFPDLCDYLERLKINKYEDFLKVKEFSFLANEKDIEIVCAQTGCKKLVASFLLLKNEDDLVNAIMEYQDL